MPDSVFGRGGPEPRDSVLGRGGPEPRDAAARRVSTPSEIRRATLERHADELGRWAMRREKDVALLDLRGARQARVLAEELRALVASDLAGVSLSAVSDAIARARSLMANLDGARRGVIASSTHTRSSGSFKPSIDARPEPSAPAVRPPARPRLRTTLFSAGLAPRARKPSDAGFAYRDTVPAMEALFATSSDDSTD